jgi:hypothetical protein
MSVFNWFSFTTRLVIEFTSNVSTSASAHTAGQRPVSQFTWTSGGRGCPPFPPLAVWCLEDTYRGCLRGANRPDGIRAIKLVLFMEYKRNGKLFRSHPSYRGDLPWHDWAMFRYEKNEQDTLRRKTYNAASHADEVFHGDPPEVASKHHYAPGKSLCFVQDDSATLKAVVLCCAFKHSKSGVFSTHWKIEYMNARKTRPYVLLIDVNAIVRHCLMIPENNEAHGYHEIWDKERWAGEFC